uniref:Uncharacterized protein n=1 Tax=Haplochromis burtoni TaxID=8153 RepID=A0A3Q2VZ49_HAPBU
MLHHYSDILGYLDLQNTTAVDLVLQECELTVGCLSCSQEGPMQNLAYGQTKEFNCENCHTKLSILAESTKFHYIQPRTNKTGSSGVSYKTLRDPAVQKGKPLPEKGTCKHFKQSHRWLRYCPPSDLSLFYITALNDNKMSSKLCLLLQPYGNGKPCVSCGGMMTRGTYTSHWEGGQGCRNKVKMSRNDRQKYGNSNKTVSRKAAAEKK